MEILCVYTTRSNSFVPSRISYHLHGAPPLFFLDLNISSRWLNNKTTLCHFWNLSLCVDPEDENLLSLHLLQLLYSLHSLLSSVVSNCLWARLNKFPALCTAYRPDVIPTAHLNYACQITFSYVLMYVKIRTSEWQSYVLEWFLSNFPYFCEFLR